MIKNDLHVHSIHSSCGIHTYLEIAQIAIDKKMHLVNIADHGLGQNENRNFGVFVKKNRLPNDLVINNKSIIILKGIEATIMGRFGNCDIPDKHISKFDLINIGFHKYGNPKNKTEKENTKILINFLKKHPSDIDILVHPCIKSFPLEISTIVDLSIEYGFALEVNNTNLRINKTDIKKLKKLLKIAIDKKAVLVENSDGHTYHEIGENEKIEEFLKTEGYDGDKIFMNRDNNMLKKFINNSKKKRQ